MLLLPWWSRRLLFERMTNEKETWPLCVWRQKKNSVSFFRQWGNRTVYSSLSPTALHWITLESRTPPLLSILSLLCHSLTVDVMSSEASQQSSSRPALTRSSTPPRLSCSLHSFSFSLIRILLLLTVCQAVCQCQTAGQRQRECPPASDEPKWIRRSGRCPFRLCTTCIAL